MARFLSFVELGRSTAAEFILQFLNALPGRSEFHHGRFELLLPHLNLTRKHRDQIEEPLGSDPPFANVLFPCLDGFHARSSLPNSAILGNTGFTDLTTTTILTSVLESLRLYLPTFTLTTVLEEMQRWWIAGRSCFQKLQKKLKLVGPEKPVIDQLFPRPIPSAVPSG